MLLYTELFPLFAQISKLIWGDKVKRDYTSHREKNKWVTRLTRFGG